MCYYMLHFGTYMMDIEMVVVIDISPSNLQPHGETLSGSADAPMIQVSPISAVITIFVVIIVVVIIITKQTNVNNTVPIIKS